MICISMKNIPIFLEILTTLLVNHMQTPQNCYSLQSMQKISKLVQFFICARKNVIICICYNLHMQNITDCVILSTSKHINFLIPCPPIPCILPYVTTTTTQCIHSKNSSAIQYSFRKHYAVHFICSDLVHFDAFGAFCTDALVHFGSGIQVQGGG